MKNLEIRNVIKNYGTFNALRGVDFKVEPGEFVVMVGPSGCGKSTLLRSIAGLETISSGQIVISGRDVSHVEPSERGVAMVFQNYALYPHMTVRQNMGFALRIAGKPKKEIDEAVNAAAKILKISEHLEKTPKQLSGGQKQRVAIGRAITRSPDVFLFDEPLSNLDAALRSQMRVELARLHAELKATMIYVTHDQTEAMTMASRIVVFNAGDIEQIGTPLELYNRPANRFVAGFLGSPRMNFVKAKVAAINGGAAQLAIEGTTKTLTIGNQDLALNQNIIIGIRPENIIATNEASVQIKARVAVVESLGRETLLYADAGSTRTFDSESQEGYFAIHHANQSLIGIDDEIVISLSPDKVFIFSEEGQTLHFPKI